MMTVITPEIVAEHGLSESEYQRIQDTLGRAPNLLELGIYSVMWSEHCSYKSSRRHLKTLPTEAPWVICGPGENAGVIDIGDNQAAIFKMESHNHPSFIEPYEGAATGVGGILRDVFTMGARPIANMNALRFGAPDNAKTKHLVSGVVAGIGGYGNCVGVPTVGGETDFDASYNNNILVNAMTVGLADQDKIFYSAAAGIGNPVVYVGAKTGRDGIHGATMASTEFSEETESKRPTVQVGDPFTEKLLIEACLELMATDAIIAIQDMGAAGLTSSSVEMAAKGNVGIVLKLDDVPQREENMQPYEMMLSESQERMLMILQPGKEPMAKAIFDKWGLDFAVIGELVDGNNLTLTFGGETVADLPLPSLADDAPNYDRPHVPTAPQAAVDIPQSTNLKSDIISLVGGANLCSRRWIWEQYDHRVMGDTVQTPGGDAAIVRVHGTNKALAITTDCTPRYVQADPVMGGRQAVAETYRNICAVGGTPLAITNCLNFGNPERPEIMGQFVGAIQGMGEACKTLNYPVISGNVSLYNETNGVGIMPTPAIGGVGVLGDLNRRADTAFKAEGDVILLIGTTKSELNQSLYARDLLGMKDGPAPIVDLDAELAHGGFVRGLIEAGKTNSVHDLSSGGLMASLTDMALAGNLGAEITLDTAALTLTEWLFSESQARYLLSLSPEAADAVLTEARTADVPALEIGKVGGKQISINGEVTLTIEELKSAHEGFLPQLLDA